MEKAIDFVLRVIEKNVSPVAVLITALFAAGIYIWYQYLQSKLDADKRDLKFKELEFKVEKTQAAASKRFEEELQRATALQSGTVVRKSQRRKVLVVDDERVIADTLAILLNQNGYEATAAYSGSSLVERAREESPWLIFSDVIMADMNGIEAAIKAREFLPDNHHILLFSGQRATADLLEDAKRRGYDFTVFAKPAHPADLLAAFADLADGKLGLATGRRTESSGTTPNRAANAANP